MEKNNGSIQKSGVCGSTLTKIIDDTDITKKGCKFCSSPFRKEAEEEFEKTGKITVVRNFLREKKEEISYLSVRNHLHKHYLGKARRMSVAEWAEDVELFSANTSDRKSLILERIAILRREMCLIASESDSLNIEERRRSADIVKKLSDGISSLEQSLDTINEEYGRMEVLIENLKNILANKIKIANNEAVKRVLMEVLQELSENVDELLQEGEG